MPSVIVGLASAAVAALAIVFTNRGIDLAVGTLVSMFSEAKAAKLHREQVEAFIRENLPRILDDSARIERYAEEYLNKQKELHAKTFEEIRNLFMSDSETFRKKLNEHAEIFGAKTIEDDFLDELEKELMDFAHKKHD